MIRLGRRKMLALVAVGVIVVVAVVAGMLWESNGLIAVLLAVSVGGSIASGWFIAQSERRTRRLISAVERDLRSVRSLHEKGQNSLVKKLSDLEEGLGNLTKRVIRPSEHAEQLLKAINSATTRMELGLERIGRSTREEVDHHTERVLRAVNGDAERIVKAVGSVGDRAVLRVDRASSTSARQVTAVSKQLYRQLEALVALYADTRPETAFPPTRTWAASPDLLVYLYETVRRLQPTLIVECGSGVSTLVMGHALKKNESGCVVSLEHLDSYRDQTLEWVRNHDLEHWVEVRLAPLTDVELQGEQWPWYSMEAIPDGEIGLLFVDGPPGGTRPNARFPALPLLAERLAPKGLVVLDDYTRDDESSVAEGWAKLHPEWELTTLTHEKGTAIFEKP